MLGDAEQLAADDDLAALLADTASEPSRQSGRWVWYVAIGMLAVITLVNLSLTFQAVLIKPQQNFTDPAHIRLVSRDFHAHPTQAGILVLSASFVSLASRAQPFPVLSVTLLDADDLPLAHREFEPPEYLLEGVDHTMPLNPDVHVPILLEFADPGEKAVGFELEFH